jgi:hypothetical protein
MWLLRQFASARRRTKFCLLMKILLLPAALETGNLFGRSEYQLLSLSTSQWLAGRTTCAIQL